MEPGSRVDAGLRTIVVDPYPDAPAKRHAARSHDVDVKDVESIDAIIAEEDISGVLVGVADPIIKYYSQICARHGFPCYASDNIVDALTSKSNFTQACSEYGIATTPRYGLDLLSPARSGAISFPVIIKPVDCGAGVGIAVCHGPDDFREGLAQARNASPRKEVIIERFMMCDDMFAYYTFIDGVAYLSAAADRHKTARQPASSPVCIGAEYPSRHLDRFVERMHPKIVEMGRGLGIRNGVLNIQFFVDGEDFYAYDPGFRLQGEAPHIYLKHFNGFDHRLMLLDYAMHGRMFPGAFAAVNDFRLRGWLATTVWVLLKPGTVGRIEGIDRIRAHSAVLSVLQRFREGDVVAPAMAGTERQVFARIYTAARNPAQAAENVRFITENLRVRDAHDEDMILDMYNPGQQQ